MSQKSIQACRHEKNMDFFLGEQLSNTTLLPPKDAFRKVLIVMLSLVLGCSVVASSINVGIYENSAGTKGIYEALAKEKAFKTEIIEDFSLSPDILFKYDVIIFGSLKGTSESNIENIRFYVNVGGGVLLHHDACGYRGWKTPLFPEICRGLRISKDNMIKPLFNSIKPLVKDLPEEYKLAYYDHIVLGRGIKGIVVANDNAGAPAVIAGTQGAGRVVANGAVTGYWSNLAIQENGEGPPEGGEKEILLNSLKWLSYKKVSTLSSDEINKKKKDPQFSVFSQKASEPSSDWFSNDMLHACDIVHQPVSELDGKFFLFVSSKILPKFGYNRTRSYLRQLRWMGVTDLLSHTNTGDRVEYQSNVDGTRQKYLKKHGDPLMNLVKAAHEEGVNVWGFLHPGPVSDAMAARTKDGEKYVYGKYGCIPDVLSPLYRKFLHDLIDEYVDKYNKYGNFKGIYYDELFFNWVDFHSDDLELFNKFCLDHFKEALPAEIEIKLAKKASWIDPADKWWRRYVLFKNWVNTSFMKDLVDYCHKKKLKIMIELRPNAQYSNGWSWGFDNGALTKLGADYYYVATADGCEPCFIYPNALVGGHVGNTWGYYNTVSLRGKQASTHFVFNQIAAPLLYGNNPKGLKPLTQLIRNTREWAGSKNLARVSILYNQITLQLLLGDKSPATAKKDVKILSVLSSSQDADMMLIEANDYYKNYNVLIAPEYSMQGLSPETLVGLKQFVENGGILFSFLPHISSSLADLTHENDVTDQWTGTTTANQGNVSIKGLAIKENNTSLNFSDTMTIRKPQAISSKIEVLANFIGTDIPAITINRLGKGKVVSFHFDAGLEFQKNNTEFEKYFCSLVKKYSDPAIVELSGHLEIKTTLQKGNWVAVSLYSDKIPVTGVISIDLSKLGIEKEGYRILMLGKGMEIRRPGDYTGEKGFWTADEIKQGVPVTIVKDNDENLRLPEKFDLSSFSKKDASYVDRITRGWWESQSFKRSYEHEILVIAPYDEWAIGEEKTE